MKTEEVDKRDVGANQMGEPDFQDSPFDDARDVATAAESGPLRFTSTCAFASKLR